MSSYVRISKLLKCHRLGSEHKAFYYVLVGDYVEIDALAVEAVGKPGAGIISKASLARAGD